MSRSMSRNDRVMKHPRIPTSTYRLQFNRQFTFAQAREIVPYLHALGISDCYASPYFQARAESLHGYDITDHNKLNAAIGSREEYDAWIADLHAHGMGQIVDFVPNHMGIGEPLNQWWMDVLENGPSSLYAPVFRHPMEAAQVRSSGQGPAPDPGRSIRTRPGARRIAGALRGRRFFPPLLRSRIPDRARAPIGTSSRSRSKSWRLSRTKSFTRNSRASLPPWNTFRSARRPIPNASPNASARKRSSSAGSSGVATKRRKCRPRSRRP